MILAMAMPLIIKDLNIPLAKAGLLGTATLVGVGVSAILMGWMADNYGRKKTLMLGLTIFSIFTAAIAFATGWGQIMVYRFIAGLGLGGLWGVIAALIAESWPKHNRGRAASFVLSAFPFGYGLASFAALIILPKFGWQALFLFGLIGLLAVAYVYFFVPESEVWQELKKNQVAKGEKLVTVVDLFKGDTAKITIVATLLATFTLFAYWGINTWLPTFLVKERGLSAGSMSKFVLFMNVGMFIGYQVFGYLADVIGRRKTLLITFIGATVMVPVYVLAQGQTLLFWMGPAMCIFYAFFGIFGSYFAELFPPEIRSLGAGFCFNIGRGLSALAPFVLGVIATKYSLATGIGLSAILFILAACMLLFLPETKKTQKA